MSLIIGSVLPLRDRIYAKAVVDERDDDPEIYDRVMEDILRLPHGSAVELSDITSGGSGAPAIFTQRYVRCDGTANGIVPIAEEETGPVPEKLQESGAWAVGQLQDGFRAVAHDPDPVNIDYVLNEIREAYREEGTIAGLPPLSMIEVHGPVVTGRSAPGSSRVMERYMVVIGEGGWPYIYQMASVVQPGEEDDGGEDEDDDGGNPKKAGSPGEILKAMLARRHAGKDLEDAERKWRGSRWRSPCPRPGSCR